MLAMIAHPDKQKKCQEELDRVIGSSRMPTFEDQDHLPYVNAAVRELLRWRPTFPFGEPLSNMVVATQSAIPVTGVQHVTIEVCTDFSFECLSSISTF